MTDPRAIVVVDRRGNLADALDTALSGNLKLWRATAIEAAQTPREAAMAWIVALHGPEDVVVIRQLRQGGCEPVFGLAASAESPLVVQSISVGAKMCLTVPVDPARLERLLLSTASTIPSTRGASSNPRRPASPPDPRSPLATSLREQALALEQGQDLRRVQKQLEQVSRRLSELIREET